MESVINKLNSLSLKDYQNYISEQSLSSLHHIKKYCDDVYYNAEGCIPDEKYDLLTERIIELEKPEFTLPIGAKVSDNLRSVALPYYLGSMNKYKNEKEITKWTLKHGKSSYFLISEKLDGVSCLVHVVKNELKLYTRGDGLNGTDISHYSPFIKTLKNVDIKLMKLNGIEAIRGELIIKKKVFNTKYASTSANARNFVSGVINSKTLKNEIEDIDFISYEIVNSKTDIHSQYHLLNSLSIPVVKHTRVKEVDVATLSEQLIRFKQESEYEIDGIIVHDGSPYIRNTSKNPEYAFAFKMLFGENVIETEVLGVEWNVSKHNVLKPTIKIKPVNISGVEINYTTGFNAKYIVDNKIGCGSRIKITRSGDVIPHIVEIVTKTSADMPRIPYTWKDGEIDIIVDDDESKETARVKMLAAFFSDMKIKYVSEMTVTKMFQNGLDTLPKIFAASIEDLMKIDTINRKSAERIYHNIHDGLQNVHLYNLIGASGVFKDGIGQKTIEKLLEHFPTLFDAKHSNDDLFKKIMSVSGFQYITAKKIVENMSDARRFLKEIEPYVTYKKNTNIVVSKSESKLRDKTIVFSGFRDATLEEKIKNQGGKVSNSVSKNTFVVIVKTLEETSSKVEKAKSLGINVMLKDEFFKVYLD